MIIEAAESEIFGICEPQDGWFPEASDPASRVVLLSNEDFPMIGYQVGALSFLATVYDEEGGVTYEVQARSDGMTPAQLLAGWWLRTMAPP